MDAPHKLHCNAMRLQDWLVGKHFLWFRWPRVYKKMYFNLSMSEIRKVTIQQLSPKNMLNDLRACHIKDEANSKLNWMMNLEWVKCLHSIVMCESWSNTNDAHMCHQYQGG